MEFHISKYIMRVIKRVIQLFRTLTFFLGLIKPIFEKGRIGNPKRSDVLIWDASASDFLSEYVLKGINHEVLHTRDEFYHIIPYIKSLYILIISDFFCKKQKENGSELLLLYFLECIKYINPKVVVTFVDNDRRFHRISTIYRDAAFYAVQNGVRIMNDLMQYSSLDKEKFFLGRGEDYSCSDFFCFGNCEITFYQKYGARIEHYHPIGALKGSWYKYSEPRDNPGDTYSICLVSQYRSSFYKDGKAPHIYSSLVTLEDFLCRFINETGFNLCIATSSSQEDEHNYFLRKFGKKATIIPNEGKKFSTYKAMDESSIIMSFYSTAALEAFGWGKKVIFCNYSGDQRYGFNLPDPCYTDTADYDCFRHKLHSLLEKDEDEYLSCIVQYQSHYMNFNPDLPATSYVRSCIEGRISKK